VAAQLPSGGKGGLKQSRSTLVIWLGPQVDGYTEISSEHSSDRLVYTVTEAAPLLRISLAFAHKLVARDELPVIRLGRRRLMPKIALLALIEPDRPIDQTSNLR
jgi:excisionase family DNA binding protein